jgi:coenzyme F420-reducing hydrogenase delta subunit
MAGKEKTFKPLILVFSTNLISDPGLDFAGNAHIHYPSNTAILRLPCSSMVRSDYVLQAFKSGFDGVFIAADGTDCSLLLGLSTR